MRDLGELFSIYTERRNSAGQQHGRWRELASVYDGGLVTPMPEYDEVAESAVPGLIAQGIDSYARRFGEVQPACDSPAVRHNIRASRKKASERATVVRGWWQHSLMSLADYQRGRYFFGYGAMPVILRSHTKQVGIPVWEALNPMAVLPGPKAVDYSPEVPDAFVAHTKSLAFLRDTFGVTFPGMLRDDHLCQIVEYNDAEQVVVFCVGPATSNPPVYRANGLYPRVHPFGNWALESNWAPRRVKGGGWVFVLSASPNYAGMCTVSHPGAISLSRVSGIVDNILGMHKMQARLMSLTQRAIEKGIWPETWAVENENGTGIEVVREADPRRGQVGIIKGGALTMQQIQPGYQTWQMLDRLEQNQRSTAGVVPQMGGYNPTNVRTGRASDTVAGFAVDPVLAEAHEISQIAREHENKQAIAIAKGYGGDRERSFYVSAPGATKKRVDYVATDIFEESDETVVRYSLAGADMQTLIIAAQSSIATEMMSKHRARTLNPLVEDPEAEAILIRSETAEAMMLGTLNEMLTTGAPQDVALAVKLIREGLPLDEVIMKVQQQAQERQATAGELGAPDGPALPGSPEAQPGIAPEGAGAEVPPAVDEPPPSMANLAQLFGIGQRTRTAAPRAS